MISISIYIVVNILLAALPANFGALVFLRIVQAFGSSAVVSLGAGTVSDVCKHDAKIRTRLFVKCRGTEQLPLEIRIDRRAQEAGKGHVIFPVWSSVWPDSRASVRRRLCWQHIVEVDFWFPRYFRLNP